MSKLGKQAGQYTVEAKVRIREEARQRNTTVAEVLRRHVLIRRRRNGQAGPYRSCSEPRTASRGADQPSPPTESIEELFSVTFKRESSGASDLSYRQRAPSIRGTANSLREDQSPHLATTRAVDRDPARP